MGRALGFLGRQGVLAHDQRRYTGLDYGSCHSDVYTAFGDGICYLGVVLYTCRVFRQHTRCYRMVQPEPIQTANQTFSPQHNFPPSNIMINLYADPFPFPELYSFQPLGINTRQNSLSPHSKEPSGSTAVSIPMSTRCSS